MVKNKDVEERKKTAEELKNNFAILPEKKQAWDDLHRLTQDKEYSIRSSAVYALGTCYSHLPAESKKAASDDLIKLTQDKDESVRRGAAYALGFCYSHLLEESKKAAYDNLHRLTQDKYDHVRSRAADTLVACYTDLPVESKKAAWDDLIRLTQDKDYSLRWGVARALSACYSHLPAESKKGAWGDLIRLTQDKDYSVRWHAVDALGVCYSYLPAESKKAAWDDQIIITQDKDESSRLHAIDALGACYSHLPVESKKAAWDDLHRLTQDKDNSVRRRASDSLGTCYSHLPYKSKKQAWDDLHRLMQDRDKDVRVAANHSLGRVSIYRASHAKGDESVREELETALRFFEISSNEASYFNPAKFCLPFYRSFHVITFKKEEAKAEVNKYLADAKSAVQGSKSKEKLLEAVENLGNALKEAQKARDFSDVKADLNAYRRYCDRACELLETTEDKVPGASRLIRKGLPIIDERIKGIIAQIQEKAKVLCKQVKDTEYKEIGQQINNVGQELSKIINPIRVEKELSRMLIPLSAMCKKMPAEDRGEACELLKQINEEQNIEEKLPLINMFLSKISTQMNKVTIMGNSVENSNNVQVIVGTGNKQVQVSKNSQPKLKKEINKKSPISPIELFFQEKQDTINELAKKFSTYLNRSSVITEEDIKGWLLQFGNIIWIKFALRLLENIDYYEPWQMKQIFIHFYEKIIDKTDKDKIVISLLGTPKDSSSIVNYTLGEEFMRYKLETHPLEAILNSMNPDKKVIVFIDDNIGSGKQAVQIFREWLGIEKRDLNESHVKPLSNEQIEKFKRFRIYLCTFVGFEDGKDNVSVELKKMGLNVVKVYSFSKLEEEIGCFHKALKIFDNEEERMQAENMAREIGIQLFEDKDWQDEIKNKRSLGYGNSQKLIVFYYNTPTSTLPILWKEGRYNSKKWLPLFPRRDKK